MRDERRGIIGCTTVDGAVADLTAAVQRWSRDEGLRMPAAHLTCVRRAGARGRPCSPCLGYRKPLHTSADALIPILMSLRVVLTTSPTMAGAARVGVEVERTPCDSAISWHMRAHSHQVSRVRRPRQTAAPI